MPPTGEAPFITPFSKKIQLLALTQKKKKKVFFASLPPRTVASKAKDGQDNENVKEQINQSVKTLCKVTRTRAGQRAWNCGRGEPSYNI